MLDELATGWSRVSVDLVCVLGRAISRGFDPEIDYDEYQIAAMRAGLDTHPAVLLFSHRSYIDGAVVPVAMQENRLPPVHVFAGINLSFGAMGPLLRRSGVIFIRRNIADNPALQVRPARIRRLHRREAVQPQLVHRGHPLTHRQDAAAQARTAGVRGRRLSGRPQ